MHTIPSHRRKSTPVPSSFVDVIESIDTKLMSIEHLTRFYRDMAGHEIGRILSVDAEAMGGTMDFLANQIAEARGSIEALLFDAMGRSGAPA